DPGRTDDPSPLDGFVDAAPALPTAKASAVDEFRGSITRLWHLLPTLQERCCHHPCKTHFRLAGSPLPGGRRPSGSLQKVSGHPASFSGLGLAQGKFHFEPPFTSFDHLVGAGKHRRGHVEAYRLGGAHIDHKLEPRWLHHRQVRRFGAIKDAADIRPDLTTRIDKAGAVAH